MNPLARDAWKRLLDSCRPSLWGGQGWTTLTVERLNVAGARRVDATVDGRRVWVQAIAWGHEFRCTCKRTGCLPGATACLHVMAAIAAAADSGVAGWLRELDHRQRNPSEEAARGVVYQLDPQSLTVGAIRPQPSYRNRMFHEPQRDKPIDRLIAEVLQGDDAPWVLLLQTRNFYLGDVLLRQGSPVDATAVWEDQGEFIQLTLSLPDPMVLLPGHPPWYLDSPNGLVGPIETRLKEEAERVVMTSGPIRKEDGRRQGLAWLVLDQLGLPLPEDVAPKVVQGTVQMHLSSQCDRDGRNVTLSMTARYRGVAACPGDGKPILIDDPYLAVIRDHLTEHEQVDHVRQITDWSEWVKRTDALTQLASREQALAFIQAHGPTLEQRGWMLDVDPLLVWDEASGDAVQFVFTEEGEDWFEISASHDDQPFPLAALLQALRDRVGTGAPLTDDLLVPVPDLGRLLRFSPERVEQVLSVLSEGDKSSTGKLRVPRSRSYALLDLDNREEAWARLPVEVRELAVAVRRLEFPETPVPAPLAPVLREYQATGFSWLQFLSRLGIGGVLADDMGLGKTLQCVAHVLAEKHGGRLSVPALVIAPSTVVGVWRDEVGPVTT